LIVKAGKAEGKAILPARDSKPMGKKKALVKTSPNGITNPYAIYADDATLLRRKKIQSLCRPSCYAGMTALYVQCLYGSVSGQTQYDMPTMDDTGAILLFGAPSLSIKAGLYSTGFLKGQQRWVDLPFNGVNSPWVCVTRFWRYWLVTVNGVKVTFRRIKTSISIPHSAESYNGIEARQTHAALLAGAKLASTVLTFTCAAVLGSPLAYGWKTDDTGLNARMVAHTEETTTRTGRYYSAAVLFDVDGTPTGLNVQLLEEKPWDLTVGSHALWTPDWYSYEQAASAPLGSYLTWGNVECDAPLYVRAVYAGTETAWDLWRIKGSAGHAEPVGFSGVLGTAMGLTPSVPFTGTIDPGMDWGAERESADPLMAGMVPSATPSLTDTQIYHGNYWTYPRIITTGRFGYYGIWDRSYYVNLVDAKSAALLIPFYDCNAVAYGTRDFRGFDSRTEWRNEGPSTVTRETSSYWVAEPGWTEYYNGEVTWANGGIHNGPAGTSTNTGTTTISTPGVLTLLVGSAALPSAVPHLAYYEPEIGPTGNPFIDPANVLTSLGGSYTFTLSFGETGKSDWPDGTQIPVGWA
jgi:hypothetical protein